jgi:uncharacterized membrane protein YdjX (TVP38/TMEM64 family)
MLRLSPVLPFNLQNYFYGLNSIRFWPCLLASWISMLPATLLYVYVGYLGRTGVAAATGGQPSVGTGEWVLRIVGFATTIVVSIYVASVAKKAIRDESLQD